MSAKKTLECPLCHDPFGSPVALEFHVRKEHPSATDAARATLAEAYRARNRERAEGAEERARKRLDRFYRENGCPCGRSARRHLEDQKKALGPAQPLPKPEESTVRNHADTGNATDRV